MRKTMLWLLLVAVLGAVALGQVEPRGIIIEPPEPDGLTVSVWTDKPVYQVGDTARIHFEINRAAYIYIWDIRPDGEVVRIFPNQYDTQNYFQAGTHTVPTPGKTYQFRVDPPLGTEWLQILALTEPFPFQQLGEDPDELQAQVLGLIPEAAEEAFDFTSFEIVGAAPPAPGTLRVVTTPSLARLYVDGVFRGWTTRELQLAPGTYRILLRKDGYQDHTAQVTITAGRTRTMMVDLQPVRVNRPPVARFAYTPSEPRPGDWVRFDAAESYDADGSIVRYEWDFDDDGRVDATGQVAFRRFTSAGRYVVRLRVTDDQGATADTTRTITVGDPNQAPVARFEFSPEQPSPNQWVRFDAAESYDPDGSIVRYEWDIGADGTVDGTGQVFFYRFTTSGPRSVRLIVTDDQGATGETTSTIRVGVVNRPPVAQFTFSPANPLAGMSVTFDASDSYDPDGSIVSYRWDLTGDGTINRTGRVVSWTYTREGTYQATLYVTDNQGATAQTTQVVRVMRFVSPLPPGMPNMGTTPGIYVWGTDTWNITVNGSPLWGSPRPYRIELRTDGRFVGVTTDASAAPLGLVPEPADEGWRLVFEGSVRTGRVTHTFQVQGASSMWMDLRLDMNGNGTPDRTAGLVRLRRHMVSSPFNPVVVGLPSGHPGPLVPSLNFRIGSSFSYTERARFIVWSTSIESLEAR